MNLAKINLYNGVSLLFALNEEKNPLLSSAITFAVKGVRTKKKKVGVFVTNNYNLESYCSWEDINKKFKDIDICIYIYSDDSSPKTIKNDKIFFARNFPQIKLCFANSNLFFQKNPNLSKLKKCYDLVLSDNCFTISNVSDLSRINRLKDNIKIIERDIERLEGEKQSLIKTMQSNSEEDSIEKTATIIKNANWIKDIKLNSNSLIITTDKILMDFVPLIASKVAPEFVERSCGLYELIKRQLLGDNFFSFPCSYEIPNTLNPMFYDSAEQPDETELVNLLGCGLYFKGVSPHIGSGGKCYGEFAAAISFAQKNGLRYLIPAFDAYLRSANLEDAAGVLVVNLPLANADKEITCWPIMDELARELGIKHRGKKDINYYKHLLKLNKVRNNIGYVNRNRIANYLSSSSHSHDYTKENMALIKKREPKIYEQIIALRGDAFKVC